MKDGFIEEKLNELAEARKPDGGRILNAAVSEMRENNRRGIYTAYAADKAAAKKARRARSRTLLRFGAAAAAAVLFIYLVVLGFRALFPSGGGRGDDPPAPPSPYILRDLSYDVVPFDEVSGHSILTLTLSKVYTNARLYYKTTPLSPSVISILYRTVGSNGLDEIVILADLDCGLRDYLEFWDQPERVIAGIYVYSREIRQNGEYYTDIAFHYGTANYYIRVASPAAGSAYEYLEMLLYER